VLGPIHVAHAALAEQLVDPIRAECRPDVGLGIIGLQHRRAASARPRRRLQAARRRLGLRAVVRAARELLRLRGLDVDIIDQIDLERLRRIASAAALRCRSARIARARIASRHMCSNARRAPTRWTHESTDCTMTTLPAATQQFRWVVRFDTQSGSPITRSASSMAFCTCLTGSLTSWSLTPLFAAGFFASRSGCAVASRMSRLGLDRNVRIVVTSSGPLSGYAPSAWIAAARTSTSEPDVASR